MAFTGAKSRLQRRSPPWCCFPGSEGILTLALTPDDLLSSQIKAAGKQGKQSICLQVYSVTDSIHTQKRAAVFTSPHSSPSPFSLIHGSLITLWIHLQCHVLFETRRDPCNYNSAVMFRPQGTTEDTAKGLLAAQWPDIVPHFRQDFTYWNRRYPCQIPGFC